MTAVKAKKKFQNGKARKYISLIYFNFNINFIFFPTATAKEEQNKISVRPLALLSTPREPVY